MASQTDEFKVTFKTEGGHELEEAFRRSGDAADHFHQRVTKVGGALGDLRLKAEARVAHNVGEIASAFTQGADAGDLLARAITAVTESFRGSILFAGAATAGYALYTGITKVGEAAIQLKEDLASLRAAGRVSGDFIGADQVNKNLDAATSKIEELEKRYATETAPGGLGLLGKLTPTARRALRGVFEGHPFETFDSARKRDLAQINEARAAGADALDQQAQKQKTANEELRIALQFDEKRAGLAKVTADHNERLGAIAGREARFGITNSEARRQEDIRFGLESSPYRKAIDLEEKKFDLEAKIVDVQKTSIGSAEENLQVLNAQVAAVKGILDSSQNLRVEEQEQYRIQLGSLEAARDRARFARDLQRDLAGIHLGGVEGRVTSGQAESQALQRAYDFAVQRYGADSPEAQEANARRKESGFQRYQRYQRDPSGYVRDRQKEKADRESYEYRRAQYQNSPYTVRSEMGDELYGGGGDSSGNGEGGGSTERDVAKIRSIMENIIKKLEVR